MARKTPAGRYSAAAGPVEGRFRLWPHWLLVLGAFIGAALSVYAPALEGPFLSDDLHYVATNPYVKEISVENFLAILDPNSPATVMVVNWAPVHLLGHALEWQAFGNDTRGFHVVNVLLHALASLLLALLLARSGVPDWGAVAGGALFLLHPANVEAVAWISQLKSSAALVLAFAALLMWPRHPISATVGFALALLAKGTALFALPAAVVSDWIHRERPRWGWLALWAALFTLYTIAEFSTHNRTGEAAPLHVDFFVQVRSIVAIAGRYLVMAATSYGTSAFHEPPAAESLFDPWWLLSAPVLVALGWRTVWAIIHKREEAIYWVWAAVSFAPVSQVFPFLYPMADRYLYFILPGLLGGVLLAGRDLLDAAARQIARRSSPRDPAVWNTRLRWAALALGAAVMLVFADRSHDRAGIWSSPYRVSADAARHYPNGRSAHLQRARRAARSGDKTATFESLQAAVDRGFNTYRVLLHTEEFRPYEDDPRFQHLIQDTTQFWIDWGAELESPTQVELRTIALAHIARRDYEAALELLERALEEEGPVEDLIKREVELVRRAQQDPSLRIRP